MGKNRNRDAGHNYERKFVNRIKHIFPNVVTSRYESKSTDDKKVDLCFTGPYNFQCKFQMNTPPVKLLDEMPEGINVIIWGKTVKANVNFVLKEEYAIIKLDEFIKLIG